MRERSYLSKPSLAVAFVVALGLGALVAPSPAAAQGTPEQRAACQDDAFRVCPDAIPDEARVRACFIKNRHRLSIACRRVMATASKGRGGFRKR